MTGDERPAGRPAGSAHRSRSSVFGPTLALLLAATNAAAAGTELVGTVETVAIDNIVARGIAWTVTPGREDSALDLKIARIEVGGVPSEIEDLRLRCPHWEVEELRRACAEAELTAVVEGTEFTARIGWESRPPDLMLSVETELFDGQIAVTLEQDAAGQRLALQATDVALTALPADWVGPPADTLSLSSGRVSLTATLASGGDGAGQAEMAFTLTDLSFDSSDGTVAGAGLGLSGRARADLGAEPYSVWSELVVERGEALYAPIYLAFDAMPSLRLEAELRVDADGGFALPSLTVGDGEALTVTGSGRIGAGGEILELVAEIEQFMLPLAFERYLKTAFESTGVRGLHPRGTVRGQLELRDGDITQVTASLVGFGLDDDQQRYLIDNLRGTVHYDAQPKLRESRLSWDRVGYYAVVFQSADARFQLGGHEFRLLEPLLGPVLNGGLRIDELAVRDWGTPKMSLDFEGEILAISLEQITRALDWPVFQGSLSGKIPGVHLSGGVAAVDGAIRLDVFDGEVIIDRLKLGEIFNVLPTLDAEVEINGVDLQQMTAAFSFGEIEGRLDGSVKGLHMVNWQPAQFDLVLKTPDNYRGKRKISQRAIDNLSSLGGGAAVLSETLLRFFKKFSYERLGLSCRLINNVCTMGGVAPAAQGFYIVEGAGVPRINIIGFRTKVDWPQLLRRLKAATEGGMPSLE